MKKIIVVLVSIAAFVLPVAASAQQSAQGEGKKEWPIPYEYKRIIFGDTVTAHEKQEGQAAGETALQKPEGEVPRVPNPEATAAAALKEERVRAQEKKEGTINATQGMSESASPAASVFESTVWDFGTVKQGDVLQYEFILENKSRSRPLKVLSVNTSCGCTVSQVKKKILEPGESTTMAVELKTKGYAGPVKQYVYVHTDDPDENLRRFIIKANVTTAAQ